MQSTKPATSPSFAAIDSPSFAAIDSPSFADTTVFIVLAFNK
jgi:hypothetical protein